jgi:putative aldouronate transport system permease protein
LKALADAIRRDRVMLALALPGVAIFLLFGYLPLLGNVIAFQDYLPFLGIAHSPWVGLDNVVDMFHDRFFWRSVENTLVITAVQLLFYFPAPLLLALFLHSIMSPAVRRFMQSVVYLPHFISWVIVVALFQQVLGEGSAGARLFPLVGLAHFHPMTDPQFFKWLVTIQLIWRDAGWGAIIYLAALLAIDETLYEAAVIDGAGSWARFWHITLPSIAPVTILLLILRLGNSLTVGFEQMLLQRDAVGARAGDVLDSYIYFQGVVGGQWGVSAAAGLFKGIIGTAIVIAADRTAKAFGQPGIYST